ncbi:MAG: hypothetical protein ACFFB0_05990 [Promethearchaeota archaeon]
MADFKIRKILISILLIIVILLYLFISILTFISVLEATPIAALVLRLFQNLSYLGFGFAANLAFLIIPIVIILMLNSKKFDIEKSVLFSRILAIISCVINFAIFLLNLMFLTWVSDQSGAGSEEVTSLTTFPVMYIILLIINLITYLLMTIKTNL